MNDPSIFEEYGRTLDKKRPLYAGSVIEPDFAFHTFASYGVIDLIKAHIPLQERRYLMDGTFKIKPRQYSQLLVMSIEYKNNVRLNNVYIMS